MKRKKKEEEEEKKTMTDYRRRKDQVTNKQRKEIIGGDYRNASKKLRDAGVKRREEVLSTKNRQLKQQFRADQAAKQKYSADQVRAMGAEEANTAMKGLMNTDVSPEVWEQLKRKAAPDTLSYERENRFREEDVAKLKADVLAQEELLEPSLLQQGEAVRTEGMGKTYEEYKEQNKYWMDKGYIDDAGLKELYELDMAGYTVTPEEILKRAAGSKTQGIFRQTFGDFGQDLLGISYNEFSDALTDATDISALTGVMSEQASFLPAIEGATTNAAITPQQALAELNQAEKDADILQGNIARLAVLRPELTITKEYEELMAELETYRADIRDARGTALETLREGQPEFNVLETQRYIEEIDKLRKKS